MKIETNTTSKVRLNLADLETYLKERNLISSTQKVVGISSTPEEIEIMFESFDDKEIGIEESSALKAFLDTPILEYNDKFFNTKHSLSVRLINSLLFADLKCFREFSHETIITLVKHRNFGEKSWTELRDIFKTFGILLNYQNEHVDKAIKVLGVDKGVAPAAFRYLYRY